ncbi:hypothetical protein BJ138DRAFT_1139752 [Hygrophoropsis aurantiaca]|uniref:Uncharacterized protein n=1 Tax=Hygrophoropsis aurantiaca TaxID=72124 RepID=A0ACB8AT77_9AGAM|nr:hypothetical protein BJ138DRAFT_1139752 [Hygrophoropsis aurantiaca]
MSQLQRPVIHALIPNTTTRETFEIIPESSAYIPYSRRRISPAQRHGLEKAFMLKSHPSREERITIAAEMEMEFKSVTNWFQNRRQVNRRRSSIWDGNEVLRQNKAKARAQNKSSRLAGKKILVSSTPRPPVLLDHIAQLSERPVATPLASTSKAKRQPLTPRTKNTQQQSPSNTRDIWKFMVSSPVAPQSSPSAEEARMAVLPSRAKMWRSMEWACLKARRGRKAEDEEERTMTVHPLSDHDDTDTESDEAVTPDASVNLSPKFSNNAFGHVSQQEKVNDPFGDVVVHQSEDVEAAMLLLGFMGRK